MCYTLDVTRNLMASNLNLMVKYEHYSAFFMHTKVKRDTGKRRNDKQPGTGRESNPCWDNAYLVSALARRALE